MRLTEKKRAQKALDALLREAPDRMLRLLEEGDLTRTLEQLREAEAPGPEWVRAKARNLRLKCGYACGELRELEQALRGALSAWEEAGCSDALRTAQAGMMLEQIAAKTAELRSIQERMTTLIRFADSAEEGARQADLLTALAQLRSFGKEAAE